MKVYFVDGKEQPDGTMIIYNSQFGWVCGYYKSTTTTRIMMKRVNKRIVVVKQKSRWFTLLILIHELAHWFAGRFFSRRTCGKLDDWIEEHLT